MRESYPYEEVLAKLDGMQLKKICYICPDNKDCSILSSEMIDEYAKEDLAVLGCGKGVEWFMELQN